MGKRKYETGEEGSPKKNKKEGIGKGEEDENMEDKSVDEDQSANNVDNIASNRHSFDVKHFRKELSTKQGQTMALTQFLQVCLDPDNKVDYMLAYLKSGGNSHEILRQITQDSKKNITLATPAFHIFHLIILKVQSELPHMISVTEEASRYFLNTFMSTVEIMISENSSPRHRKIILKLLTSIVTLNPDLGVEVLNQAPLTPKHLQYIIDKANVKEKDNVRTAFVHLMTSFLVEGHLPLIKALLEKQGLLPLVIPGLITDDAEAVLMFLNILKKNVIENPLISKSLKLKTFSHQVLHNLFKIFSWKGPPDLSNDSRNEARPHVMELLSEIILTLFTSHKLGLYFMDNSLGTIDANKNLNLYKALLTLKRPWENQHECDSLLQIVYKCPDLHRAVVHIVEQSFEPQHSPIWEKTADFLIKLLDKLKPEEMIPRMSNLSSQQTANFVRFITLPVPLLKFITNHLGKDQCISMHCIKVLVKMLQALRRYIQILELDNSPLHIADLRNKLDYFVPKHLPPPSTIVALVANVMERKSSQSATNDYKLPEINDTDSLISLLDTLLLYNDIHPSFFETLEGSLDMKKLLNFSETLSDDNLSLLKFKIVSLWLTLDGTASSLDNPMFKDLFLIMLEVYTSDDDNTWIESKETLYKFLRSTSIFERDEDEIHLMLYTLRNSKVNPSSIVGDVVEYVLANMNDLNEYIRNQIVHFEISDENSEANLDKLFDDLMENKKIESSVFLENKIPSPFIVGCTQYIQGNREAKKNLKHFLSLYAANLLHYNYSPELTEVLIGDSKLEVRNYIANWVSQPTPLPDGTVDKDNVLNRISNNIIKNQDDDLKNIFNCLEESTMEEYDFVLREIPYRVNIANNIDNSELLMWAKYLIFCTVRLTNMKQLSEDQQKKISDYFECLLTIGKKYHKVDICRTITLSLFKNPHFLKIYRLLDTNKGDSSTLATRFLLDVIRYHGDIINHLDMKNKILKSYQQKNYNEIVKAFVKINKRKNVDSGHTIHVLEVIGLSKEDDVRVFNLIFGAELNTFIKEDKEPSIALELLRILIDKYSKSVTLELPQGTLKKALKLYTNLLTNTEITPNLTGLETTLIQYFETKPYHVSGISDDIYKKFFEVNVVRKTTSQLASVLLKHNIRFCNIFKEQMSKTDILSQRELTLPLGNSLLYHNQFIIENKELLVTIYNEYKSNIIKVLEKPHKAGQIYVNCWTFVRKLILECMELEDCKKLYNKSHKFEVIELSHVNLFQAVLLKICLLDEKFKTEYIVNYFFSTLHLITLALKEGKAADVIKEIVANVYNVTDICNLKPEMPQMPQINIDQGGQELKKIVESSIWQNFCKAVLKDSLKVKTANQGSTCGPELLCLLSALVKLFYPPNHDDVATLFDMVTSHSEFLNVMLSYHSSDIKSRLVEFIYVLISNNSSVMKTQQIPVYLSAYHATRSPCDRLLLKILHYYESNGQPVNEYKPYVFGDSAANHYAVRKNRTSSLWAHPTPNQVLNLFEKDVIERTVRNYPVILKLDYQYELPLNSDLNNDGIVFDGTVNTIIAKLTKDGLLKPGVLFKDNEAAVKSLVADAKYKRMKEVCWKEGSLLTKSQRCPDESIYDPMFLFPLLSHLLAPGSMVSCFKILRTGLLAVPVMALSSTCPIMTAAACHVLHRFCLLLETETKHKNDKLFLTDFFDTLCHSLASAKNFEEGAERIPDMPSVVALYLAKGLMVSTAPHDPLYKPVNNFFIAKEAVDLTVVPDFLSLFHDSEVESADRRLWILDVIRDGTKTWSDVNVVFKTMCLKMIMDFSSSVLCDKKCKERILEVLCSVAAVPLALDVLVEGYSLVSWLHCTAAQLQRDERSVVKKICKLLETMLRSKRISAFSMNTITVTPKGKPVGFHRALNVCTELENEIMIILYDLLHNVDSLEVQDVSSYVRIYSLISKRAIKLLSKKQVLTLVSKCGAMFKDSECIKLLTKAVVKSDSNMLKSKIFTSDECLIVDLVSLVKNYLG